MRLRCPYCGATLTVPRGVTHVVCPYCGAALKVSMGAAEAVKLYWYPQRTDASEAWERLAALLEGLPQAANVTLTGASTVMLPLYGCRVRGEPLTSGRRCPGAGWSRTVVEPAAHRPGWLGEGFGFPLAGREPYRPARRSGVAYLATSLLEPSRSCRNWLVEAERRAAEEAWLEGCPRRARARAEVLGVAHYPFIRLQYTGMGRRLEAYVDAVTGDPVYAEYPVNQDTARAMGLAAMAAPAALALALGALAEPTAALAPLAAGLITALPAFLLSRRGKAAVRPSTPGAAGSRPPLAADKSEDKVEVRLEEAGSR